MCAYLPPMWRLKDSCQESQCLPCGFWGTEQRVSGFLASTLLSPLIVIKSQLVSKIWQPAPPPPRIPALGRWRQENQEFKLTSSYKVSLKTAWVTWNRHPPQKKNRRKDLFLGMWSRYTSSRTSTSKIQGHQIWKRKSSARWGKNQPDPGLWGLQKAWHASKDPRVSLASYLLRWY